MLKRLLLTATLAASTLIVTGTATTPPAGATSGGAASACTSSAQLLTATPQGVDSRKCEWRWWHHKWCKYCWRHGHWERDEQPRLARGPGALCHGGENGLGRVAAHRLAAAAAIRKRGPREQQLQVIVQFGHRADRRARGAYRIGLIDGNRGRDPVDSVHQRLVHAIQELPCIGGKCLDVTSLPFGIQGIENQRGLSRPADAGDHDQLIEREIEIEIFQVVLAGAADADGIRARRF